MRRSLVAALVLAASLVVAAGTLQARPSARRSARPSARRSARSSCTAAQKAARTKALAAYEKRLLRDRKAYFRTHTSKQQRAAFIRRQRARLAALRAAAACTVASAGIPPPSSGPACAPSLPSTSGNPYNEGTNTDPRAAPSTGDVRAVMLFVDTADRPASGDPTAVVQGSAADLSSYYGSVSYGRLSLTVTSPAKWFRLPKPAAAYTDVPFDGDRNLALLRDAVAAADPEVDFRAVDIVYVVATPLSGAYGGFDGAPKTADGVSLTHFAEFDPPNPDLSHGILHETGHVFGLPHVNADFWDIMDQPKQGSPLLGWQRYKLHWIDPGQIRCLNGSGTLEDTLAPIDGPGGIKLLVAQTSASTGVVAEFKQGSGGVLVTTVDANAPDRQGLIVQTRGTALDVAPLKPGQELTAGQVTVRTLAVSSTAARVRMTWR